MQYTLVGTEDGSNITVILPGRTPLVAHSTHPNFAAIVEGVQNGDESVADLFDVAVTAVTKFNRLTERVTTANGRLYLDGEEVANALAEQVVRFLSEGVEDWKPLVAFFENVQSNPNEHSREQLYNWLSKRDFTITQDGLIVGYKGVDKKDDTFLSIHSGTATVNGEVRTGRIPQKVGDVVEMPRNVVQHDPAVGCHTGLHVGTYDYAQGYAYGALLEVHVNPRDVVSVPTDCDWAKVRVCRYKVIGTIDKKYDEPVLHDEDEGCPDCGACLDDCCGECQDGFGDEFVDGVDNPEGTAPHFHTERDRNQGLGCTNPNCLQDDGSEDEPEDAPKTITVTIGDKTYTLSLGDMFEDTDKRRAGRKLKVEDWEDDGEHVWVRSLPQNIRRRVQASRLFSRKYKKAS